MHQDVVIGGYDLDVNVHPSKNGEPAVMTIKLVIDRGYTRV